MNQLIVPDDAETIWRYMDFWKLEKVIKTFGLYFVRSDRFKYDTWDSVIPPIWLESMQEKMGIEDYTFATWYKEREIPSNPIQCWSFEKEESDRMWNEYTTNKEAVAIRSTVGRLKDCFSRTTEGIRIGLVNYGDHGNIKSPQFSAVHWSNEVPSDFENFWYVPRFLKKQEYAHEKELRATLHVDIEYQPIDPGYNLIIGQEGVSVLIDSIIVHPRATEAFLRKVRLLLSKHGLDGIEVNTSKHAE